MSKERIPGELGPGVAEVVESWKVPPDAKLAARIRDSILVAIERGYSDPELVADLAVGPLVIAVGQLEVELAAARRRIDELSATVAALPS